MDENKEENEKNEAEFKNMLFAHGVMSQRPDLFWELYPHEVGMSEEAEAQIQWERPETPMDLEMMMSELRDAGWSG